MSFSITTNQQINEYYNKYLNIQTNDYANNNSFNKKIMRFSIFRMLPINLRYDFYDDKGWFLNAKEIVSKA